MKSFIVAILSICISLTSCSSTPKFLPEHKGVDPRLKPMLEEFMWLSKQNNITFSRQVSMGFKKIKRGNVIGVCTYGGNWREIDVDIDFWLNNPPSARWALVFHELAHCYCTRGHDYGEDKEYPESLAERIAQALDWREKGGERPGYWDDGCPVSILYPKLVDSDCFLMHYQEYVKEMFDRCNPW